MRKNSLRGFFYPKSLALKQIFLTMKITLFLLLFATFQAFSATGYSQSVKINIGSSNLTISELLDQIESQTEYLFVYNKKNVDTKRVVNVNVTDKTVAEVLNDVFKGTDVDYVVEGHNIVLTKSASTKTSSMQQNSITVKGTVVDNYNEPVIGANVVEQGTTNGTITDLDGNFTINVPADATLEIRYVGYKPSIIPVNGRRTIDVKMEEESLALEQVVVTAMGIKRKEASLTYSTQQVGGDELTRAKDPNMINALAGKSAGVQISRNSSGLGGSAKVSIRGIRSANENGNNQPLYVIDGVPMLNSTSEQAANVMGGDNDAGNRDSGDGISNLNPDDIESMSILKGASAAALYGSQAANGVILITTKRGKAGMQRITFSSNLSVDHATDLPKFQNNYARDVNDSWGAKGNLTDYNNLDGFYSNGITAINSLSVQAGKEKFQTYFSYSNTNARGIIDANKMQKHNLTLRETASLFNDRLTLDANVNLMTQTIKNRPSSGGYYMNPLVGLYTFPRGTDLGEYKNNFEVFDPARNMMVQNWYTATLDFEQNPYWITNRITSNDKRYRALASLSASLKVNDWFTLQARGNVDMISDIYRQKMYATTALSLTHQNGRYIDMNSQDFMAYGDAMAMFNKTWTDWSLNAAVGTSINSTKSNMLKLDSGKAGLFYANVFTVSNINFGGTESAFINQTIDARRTIQSVFGTAQVGFKESLYLDITMRNDWSSTLANTKHVNKGFFYPSIGASWLIDRTIAMPEWVSFGKVRASWAQVGNDLPIGITSPADVIMAGGVIQARQYGFDDLKPEISSSWEAGMEWSFLERRLDFDLTFYRTDTKNQLLYVKDDVGRYPYKYINAGKIRNTGVEITLGATPVMTEQFRWKTGLNFSMNKNKIVSLGDYESFTYGDDGLSMPYRMRIVEGGRLGDIYGNDFVYGDDGKIVVGDDGLPMTETGSQTKLGNSNPDWLMGWNNTFTWKGFSLYMLIDARVGGDVISLTQMALDWSGASKNSGDARDAGFVEVGGRQFSNVQGFYKKVGSRGDGVTEFYKYDATNIRLRELSLGYSFPRSLLNRTKVIQGLDLSFVARNLFFFYKKAPFDPDAVMSVGNSNQGVDCFGMPSTRNMGFNIKFTF